ncbi:MAG: DEAD/DEAH box helicase, partial [Pseudomonadales bacterium]|nr:DEAD/DEAH box helicase [Pseudomonadales bacterium]
FVQFVGRIMRVIKHDAPGHPLNQGVVVFHAGANIARRWQDFQQYSEADQDYFDQLLPLEGLEFREATELEVDPVNTLDGDGVDVRGQGDVRMQEIPLLEEDDEAMAMVRALRERGFTPEQVVRAMQQTPLTPVPTTRVLQRQAERRGLNTRIRNETGRILAERGANPQGHDLDRARRGRTNFVVLKAAIDRAVSQSIGRAVSERHDWSRAELDSANANFGTSVAAAVHEVFGGA